MAVRTKFEDIASMALIYIHQSTGSQMISYDTVVEFEKVINENLDTMNKDLSCPLFYDEESKLYFCATDENGKVYLVIDPRADLERCRSYHIGCLPIEVIIASQMENALDVIGIQLIDGMMRKKKKEVSGLTKKLRM